MQALLEYLTVIEDKRSTINRKYDLIDVMFLIISGIGSGCEGWKDLEIYGHSK